MRWCARAQHQSTLILLANIIEHLLHDLNKQYFVVSRASLIPSFLITVWFFIHASICTSTMCHWKNVAQKPCSKVQLGKKDGRWKKERKQARIPGRLHLQELHTANCWFIPLGGCTILLGWWQGINMELRSAFSTSSEASLLSKHITYSITAVSQGSVILPSLVNPNSSCDSFRSSAKTVVWR